ncbi:tRNA (N(6)-L-threonylcarbamoyladenosine(37)-C(2))-methylthiotransferase MtaB [Adhaeretor mobilis]|uniref:Threonylcarbamoyladenosine tRNA methylthiotransferase MtaB n=1 Tax=Adhaeretor mobilis TaxID=1930276 RepID=A0A517MSM9_9BACT|nr:tRNA (N(6)-L-threonylcarbamoyladenosine(37)-C(2))-methylthiotransferase MtaB [Adhaeretor mobilis]QDS97894.1 Threonylcarbamoyladenosine tRNA methylthiotransferase MtaB [Adhaeretor mobilis]
MKLRTHTLGCKVNQYETEYIREGLHSIGYGDAAGEEPADLCIVNTCTVTSEGDSKSRQIIRRMARDNPASKIVVMGCYATRAPEEVAALPNVTEVLTDKRELPDLLGRFGVTDVPTGISGFGRRQRAYVKVQDGCMLRCSFCIIPHVRPELTSRPKQHVLDEVRRLVDSGYREVVLTGIHLGHYGVDWNRNVPKEQWTRLSNLVRDIAALPGDFRIRLSSIEATEVTRELITVMQEHPKKVCPHLHISMQSGSDSVLRRMRRRWGSQRFIDRCGMLRDALDRPAITTDIIVGFPGETDAEFAETCETARAAGFSKIHIFPFSARRGTPAADLPDQLPKKLKQARGRELVSVETELRDEYYRSLVGMPLRVLLEAQDEKGGKLTGTSCRYATIEVESEGANIGDFVEVIAGGNENGTITASKLVG